MPLPTRPRLPRLPLQLASAALHGSSSRTAARANAAWRRALLALLSVASLGAGAAASAETLRPGLWNYALQTRRGDGPAMDLAQMLRSLPDSARPQLDARLREQGMALGPDGNLRICLDAQSVAPGHPPLHLQGRCDIDWAVEPGDAWKFHYHCSDPTADGTGEMRISSATAYTSDYTVQSGQGSVTGKVQASWLGASCGSLAPLRESP